MKKVAFLLVCVLFGLKCLIANPLPTPYLYINEFMFDSAKGWVLELECYGNQEFPFVRMAVLSSSGSDEAKILPVWDGDDWYSQFFVLTRDDMESKLDINPLGDKISVEFEYFNHYEGINDIVTAGYVIFGNYQGSRIHAPLEGQSIGGAYIGLSDIYYYAKTNEPTIGAPNDVSKMYGTLTGKIYDKNNKLLLSSDSMTFFYTIGTGIPSYPNVPIVDGSYSIKTLANRFSRDYVFIANQLVKIKSFTIDIEPDAIIEQNIYLRENVGIAETSATPDFPIRIYPNPLSGGQALRYEVGTPVKSLECRMELVSMDGRTMFESKINDHTGTINLPQSLSNGMYIVNFKLNNKIHYSTRLIIGQ